MMLRGNLRGKKTSIGLGLFPFLWLLHTSYFPYASAKALALSLFYNSDLKLRNVH